MKQGKIQCGSVQEKAEKHVICAAARMGTLQGATGIESFKGRKSLAALRPQRRTFQERRFNGRKVMARS